MVEFLFDRAKIQTFFENRAQFIFSGQFLYLSEVFFEIMLDL